MRRANSLLALLLALCWAPATSHCLLETAGAIPEFLHCADACAPGESDSGGDADSCASVETASYKSEERPVLVVQSPSALAPIPAIPLEPGSPRLAVLLRRPAETPEAAATWRFTCRAAAPPRAPSLPA